MFYRKLTYPAVIFSVIKPMVLKKSELTLPSKMQNTPFRQGKTFLTSGIVIIGCIRNVIWLSVFSIKSKLFAELLLVMISLLHRFLLLCTLLPFGFCLNDTTLLSFQIRSRLVLFHLSALSIEQLVISIKWRTKPFKDLCKLPVLPVALIDSPDI